MLPNPLRNSKTVTAVILGMNGLLNVDTSMDKKAIARTGFRPILQQKRFDMWIRDLN